MYHGLERAAAETDFSGVISIFRGDESVFNKAYGYRDIPNKLPNTTGTLFGIASGTKFFTALGIGTLVEQGVLTLGTKIEEIDRGYKGFIDGEATILQLLTHTSGIYDYYDEEIEQDFENFTVNIAWSELETPSDYLPLFEGKAMKFHPGERFSYSNGGYVFLGVLIERLTGLLYRDFIRQHVLQPAGMHRSGFHSFNDLPENTANGYFEDRQTTNVHQLPPRGGGDGGMFTTTGDLHSFWENLLAHKILSKGLTDTFLETHWKFNDRAGYGCGVYKRLDGSMFWISGSDAGVGCDSRHLVQEQLTINILTNITNGEEAVRKAVLEALAERR